MRVAAPGRVDLAFGEGWHPLEELGAKRWRWSAGTAGITITNPSPAPLTVSLHLRVRALGRGRLHVDLADARLGVRTLSGNPQRFDYSGVVLPPGKSTLILQIDGPAGRASETDPRVLAVALSELAVSAAP